MSVKENKIEGDVIISGDVTTGGGVVANGDSVFNRDVIIKGKLDASNIVGAGKGAFPDEAALKNRYPNPKTGWWALVKYSNDNGKFKFTMYLADSLGWYNSGQILDNVSVDLKDIELSNGDALNALNANIERVSNGLATEITNRANEDANLLDRIVQLEAGSSGGTSRGSSILPFSRFVEVPKVLTASVPSGDKPKIVFNLSTNKFVFEVIKNGLSSFYGKAASYDDYGLATDEGRIPYIGLYICNDGVYKWDGSNMVEITDFPTKTSELINNSGFITLKDITGDGGDLSNLASSALPFEFTTSVEGGVNLIVGTYTGEDGEIVYQGGVFYCRVRAYDGIKFYSEYAGLSKYGNTASNYCSPENNRLYYDKTSGKIYIGKNRVLIPSFVTKTSELDNDSKFVTEEILFKFQTLKKMMVRYAPDDPEFVQPELCSNIINSYQSKQQLLIEFANEIPDKTGIVFPEIGIRGKNSIYELRVSFTLHGYLYLYEIAYNPGDGAVDVNYSTCVDLLSSHPSQSPPTPSQQSAFSRIGYTAEEVDICHDDELDYSEEVKAKYEIHEISDFSNDNNLVYPPMVDTSAIKDLSRFYFKCGNILTIPKINLSSATKTVEMLAYCYSLRSIPEIDTSGVVDMDSMFYNCTALVSVPLLATSKVVNMARMFSSCTSLKTIPMIDCHSVRNTSNMFNNCQALVTVPSLNTKSADNMKKMFADCAKLEKVEGLEFGNVTDMSMMFTGCTNLKHLLIYDLGKSQLEFYNFADVVAWGTGGESNRDSLIESLVEHSFDRASAGMTTATIRLSADSRALLTNDNISRIASKGYEVVVY